MTAYFDQLQHEISEASTSYRGFDNSDMMFLLLAAKVEARAIRAARAIAELPELPQDLANKIVCAIESNQTPEARDYRIALRSSQLVTDLHSVFHEIAQRHVQTRFGELSDDPEGTLRRLEGNGRDAFTDHTTECETCRKADWMLDMLCPEGLAINDDWRSLQRLARPSSEGT